MAARPLDPVSVTFVSSHAQMGGSELYLERLLEGLGPGWVRRVVCLQDGPFADRLRELGHPLSVIPAPARLGMALTAWRLRRALRADPPAVLHANGVKAALIGALAAVGTGIPVIWVKHDFSWDGRLARAIARGCREVVGVSAAVTQTFGDSPPCGVHVVPNGIPEPHVDRARARALVAELVGEPARAGVVGMIGRLHPAKGQLELVETAPRILALRPDTRFLILGDPDPYQPAYARTLHDRARELELRDSVVFAPGRPEAVTVIAGCDLIALPTVPDERGMGREGFGLVGVEALAVATPVAGYADGALPEVLGPCARLVAPGDRVALADAIVELLGDEPLRRRLAGCGDELVRKRYRLDDMVESMRARYREAAESRVRRRKASPRRRGLS